MHSSPSSEVHSQAGVLQKDMTTIVKEMKLEKAKKRIADPMFQWRTLRLLARANLKIYSECITERDADLEYAACEFLKDEEDLEMKQHVKVRPNPRSQCFLPVNRSRIALY